MWVQVPLTQKARHTINVDVSNLIYQSLTVHLFLIGNHFSLCNSIWSEAIIWGDLKITPITLNRIDNGLVDANQLHLVGLLVQPGE